MKLRSIAHARSGDKGTIVEHLADRVRRRRDYPRLVAAGHGRAREGVVRRPRRRATSLRYELPTIGALNFVLHGVVGGGVTRTLALDAHGKSLSSALLEMEIPDEDRSSSVRPMCSAGSGRGGLLGRVPRRRAGRPARDDCRASRPPAASRWSGAARTRSSAAGSTARSIPERSAQPDHPGSRPRAAQRARQGRVRRDVRAGQAGRSGRRPRACSSIRSSTAATATSPPNAEGDIVARQRLAGRRHSDRGATRRFRCRSRGNADGSPVTGPVLARFYDVPAGTTTVPIRLELDGHRPARLSAGVDSNSRTATPDVAHVGDVRRRAGAARPRSSRRPGRSPIAATRRFPARPIRRSLCLQDGFDRPGSTSSSTPRRIRWCSASAWPRRATSCRSSVTPPADAAGTANPVAGVDRTRDQRRRLAVGQLHQDVHPPRLQPGPARTASCGTACSRASPRGRRRSTSASRCPAAPPALYEPGSEPRRLVGTLRGHDARPARGGPARSLHRDEDLPEGHRSVRLGGVLGAAHVART